MTNFYVTYKLADKKTRDDFYKAIKESGADVKSRQETPCIRYDYFYPAEKDDELFLWEQWESRQAQEEHTKQPHFAELTDIKEKYGAETSIVVEDSAV